MTVTTRLHTYFFGKLVGVDQFGNRYFTEKTPPKSGRAKRWVLYKGLAEPSKVPPQWHGWLHYTHEKPPNERVFPYYKWAKPPVPNLTGTQNAYVPQGHLLRDAKHAPTTGDYVPWKPNK